MTGEGDVDPPVATRAAPFSVTVARSISRGGSNPPRFPDQCNPVEALPPDLKCEPTFRTPDVTLKLH